MLRLTRRILSPCLFPCIERLIEHVTNKLETPLIVSALKPMSPNLHLAVEQWLYVNSVAPTMFIRTNPTPGCIVIGNNQLAQAECNLKRIKEDGVELIRRSSGGGAVYVDGGNLMVGIFGPNKYIDKNFCHEIMTTAISNTFNVKAEFTGKNDIKVDGYKVAGLAYSQNSPRFLAHACILVDADLTALSKYLTPHQKKLISKGVTSVDQQVKNLSQFNRGSGGRAAPPINDSATRYDLQQEMEYLFRLRCRSKDWCKASRYHVTPSELLEIPFIKTTFDEMSDPLYVFGKHIEYNIDIAEKFEWGFIRLLLTVKKDEIVDVEISCDGVDVVNIIHWLKRKLRYQQIDPFKWDIDYFEYETLSEDEVRKLTDVYRLLAEKLKEYSHTYHPMQVLGGAV